MTVKNKVSISAGAIRSRARELGLSSLDRDTAYRLWDAQHSEQPDTVAGAFYLTSTDRQAIRVIDAACDKFNRIH